MLDIGLDVGSTTLKAVFRGPGAPAPRTLRHHGHLAGAVAGLLGELPGDLEARIAVTGSGGALVSGRLDVPHVHEVTAVLATVLDRYPDAGTVIELGGQDAKLILLERDAGGLRPHMSMNDRCAAGTGVTIDRCLARLGIPADVAAEVVFDPAGVRPVSGKCGVFAETDLLGLARAGVPLRDLVGSLASALVAQSLAVLARGLTPPPPVVLLGGPHVHLGALRLAWRHALESLWRERGVEAGTVVVPADAVLHAALGALAALDASHAPMRMSECIERLRTPRADEPTPRLDPPLPPAARAPREEPPCPHAGIVYVGIDAGSTRTKAVAIDPTGRLLAAASRPSVEPVADAQAVLAELAGSLRPLGVDTARALGVTGYGAAVLGPVLEADVVPVETLAHARAARAVAPDVEVVCDVGGQDIKILCLDGRGGLRDFRLSSQCSAGIGLFLETTARELGVGADELAERARSATRAPYIADACGVFLDASRVTLQRQGFSPAEILAGLCRALPRIVWTQVASAPPGRLGRVFVLQGGVQRNAAAADAQREHLLAEVPRARVILHPHAAEAGAIGAALLAAEAAGIARRAPRAIAAPSDVAVSLRSDEHTRCDLCPSRCPRTFVEITRGVSAAATHVLGHGCAEGGAAAAPRERRARKRAQQEAAPNLLAEEVRLLFAHPQTPVVSRPPRPLRLGIPRVLSMYRAAPFFSAYLAALGLGEGQVVFSPPTSPGLWRRGARHGASDPCFPVKVSLAHVHHLVHAVHDRGRPLDALFVPHFTHALTPIRHVVDSASCPSVAGAPALVKAAFDEALAARGIALLAPVIAITDRGALGGQMHEGLGAFLGASRAASDAAVEAGLASMRALDAELGGRASRILADLDAGLHRSAALVLGRPYHADPGIQHHVAEELQALGLPVLSIRSLPRDAAKLSRWLAPDLAAGTIADPFDVRDLSPDCTNSGAAERLWAARFAARHGRIAVVDLSSFKCGQDAPLHATVRDLLERASVPTLCLHDLDETRPVASLRLRLRTFSHALIERGFV